VHSTLKSSDISRSDDDATLSISHRSNPNSQNQSKQMPIGRESRRKVYLSDLNSEEGSLPVAVAGSQAQSFFLSAAGVGSISFRI
jgi:hypothetical protein